MVVNLEAILRSQIRWSSETFGPGPRTKSITNHIRKELAEIEAAPTDLEEWIDVVLLGLDGAWRTGATPAEIVQTLLAKMMTNRSRRWPDWRTLRDGEPTEHLR